jgi:hypothetical protein
MEHHAEGKNTPNVPQNKVSNTTIRLSKTTSAYQYKTNQSKALTIFLFSNAASAANTTPACASSASTAGNFTTRASSASRGRKHKLSRQRCNECLRSSVEQQKNTRLPVERTTQKAST